VTDPRIDELQALAREERLTLPYPIALIIWFEDRGYVVDLASGTVYNAIVATPTVHARAVAYLLSHLT
jgi:hypothetical protein